MSNWKEYKLRDLVTFSQGIQVPVEEQSNIRHSNMGRFVRIVDFTNPNEEPRFIKVKDSKYWVNKKDVVMIRYGSATAGKVVRGLEGYIANNMFKVIPNESILNEEFLYYFLSQSSIYSYLMNSQSSSTMPAIKFSDFDNIKIKLPSLDIQKFIVLKLNRLNEKIELNTQINQTLEQIAQALFKNWFVDFDPVRAKVQALSDGLSLEQAELAAMQAISGKTPEELTALSQTQPDCYAELAETAKAFPCEMVEVDGVEVPKGWEVKKLGSLMTIKRGDSPRPIKDFISDKGLNWVKISDATAEDNPFLFSTKEYIKSEGLSKTVLLKKGSLILSNSATPGLPRFLELEACIHDGWLYFSDIKSLTQEYLYFFFLNIRNDLVAQGNGSVFTNLKTDIVKAQKAIVPDERVIYYFDKQVKSIMNLIRYNTANSISLKETRDLLLPRLLNGELNG